jgi:isocitrate dehydrogenase
MSAVLAPLACVPEQDLIPTILPARTIAVAAGDGIGPEITAAVLRVLAAADPSLSFHEVTVGLKAYRDGEAAGLGRDALDAVTGHGVFLKGPVTTPEGGGYKSVNVTLRKLLGLYANVRPSVAYHPFVQAMHPGMDVVVIRENEEDTYAGIEHRQTEEVYQCLKLITRPGCERICRYAFEYARAHGRRKVTCMTKSNIMKLTDGLFQQVFEETARDYAGIAAEHQIIDIGTARMASRPTAFDVVVTPNLYGDILSDVAAEVSGSIGLAGSANIGRECAMFEAVHGSAPDIAGRDLANPSGLLLAAVMMLRHLGRAGPAAAIHNAWLRTLEDGVHTADLYRAGLSRRRVGTQAFAVAVIERLGELPRRLPAIPAGGAAPRVELSDTAAPVRMTAKQLVGVDVFLAWDEQDREPAMLARRLESLAQSGLRLELITNRGVKVYPGGHAQTLRADHWRCRFSAAGATPQPREIAALLLRLAEAGLEVIKTENLYCFDGQPGYSQAQGA